VPFVDEIKIVVIIIIRRKRRRRRRTSHHRAATSSKKIELFNLFHNYYRDRVTTLKRQNNITVVGLHLKRKACSSWRTRAANCDSAN